MKKQFNLSEKRWSTGDGNDWNYPEEDVKEFIKLYLDWVWKGKGCHCRDCSRNKLKKLAGQSLSESLGQGDVKSDESVTTLPQSTIK